MASILDRYGIKEIADVTFYNINADGSIGAPVLFLDTLKVSTIEQTAETTYATGGKGNANLIAWDYGKDITVALEDALFSPKSMSMMFSDGSVRAEGSSVITKTIQFTGDESGTQPTTWIDATGVERKITDATLYDEFGVEAEAVEPGKKYLLTFEQQIANPQEIAVNANTFPGTYYVTGDTFARSETTGKDEYFQFIIPKAKMTAETSITMEAEGDPSVFNMNLSVLRSGNGQMMKLVKYDLPEGDPVNPDPVTP